jgi:Bacterial RNA polymerase, alpha chain C terminal domain
VTRKPTKPRAQTNITKMSEQEITDYLREKKAAQAALIRENGARIKAELERYCLEKYGISLGHIFISARSGSYQPDINPDLGNPDLARPIESLDFGRQDVRVKGRLRDDNLFTVGDLVRKTERELLRTPNIGRTCMNSIKATLGEMGLRLGMIVPPVEHSNGEDARP